MTAAFAASRRSSRWVGGVSFRYRHYLFWKVILIAFCERMDEKKFRIMIKKILKAKWHKKLKPK